jgi:hypothetical protein
MLLDIRSLWEVAEERVVQPTMLLNLESLMVPSEAIAGDVTETSPPATEAATGTITPAVVEQPPVLPTPVIGVVVRRRRPTLTGMLDGEAVPATQAGAGTLRLVGTVRENAAPARGRATARRTFGVADDLETLVMLGIDIYEAAEMLGIDQIPDELEALALAGTFGPRGPLRRAGTR